MQHLDDYPAVRDYLYALKHHGAKYGIDRMIKLAAALGNPERRVPCIHVAGTNGKGSVCAMLESIYRHAGYRTGLYTSPHLVRQGERIQVDREILDEQRIVEYTRKLQPVAERLGRQCLDDHPSFFEFMTAMAFLRFAEEPVDISLIETGLGGRLDATNVVEPELSIITSIGHDHMDKLGDTLEAIAGEKAGIIKPGRPVLIGRLPEQAESVIRSVAGQRGCRVSSIRDRFGGDASQYPETALTGMCQRINAAMAWQATELLQERFPVADEYRQTGLARVEWAGRWQTVEVDGKRVILDCTHNPEGATALDENLARLRGETGRAPIVMAGSLGLHRAQSIFPVVARHAREIILLRPHNLRALGFEELEATIPSSFGGRVRRSTVRACFPFPGYCVEGDRGETLVATGSIYLIGQILEALRCATVAGEEILQDAP